MKPAKVAEVRGSEWASQLAFRKCKPGCREGALGLAFLVAFPVVSMAFPLVLSRFSMVFYGFSMVSLWSSMVFGSFFWWFGASGPCWLEKGPSGAPNWSQQRVYWRGRYLGTSFHISLKGIFASHAPEWFIVPMLGHRTRRKAHYWSISSRKPLEGSRRYL